MKNGSHSLQIKWSRGPLKGGFDENHYTGKAVIGSGKPRVTSEVSSLSLIKFNWFRKQMANVDLCNVIDPRHMYTKLPFQNGAEM